MIGSLQAKKLPSGKQYYYARISYTDPLSGKICHKCLAAGLETKNNKRRAEQVLMELLDTSTNDLAPISEAAGDIFS